MNSQHALLTWIQSSMYEIHSDDALKRNWGLLLFSGTLENLSIMSSNPCKTGMRQFYVFEVTTHHIAYFASFLNKTFLVIYINQIVALNHLFTLYPSFQRINSLLQNFCVSFSVLRIDTHVALNLCPCMALSHCSFHFFFICSPNFLSNVVNCLLQVTELIS